MRIVALLAMLLAAQVVWVSEAHADKFRKVSATKYEKGEPLKDYVFDGVFDISSAQDNSTLHVVYRNYVDRLHGIIDNSGRKPKWILRPKYDYIHGFNGEYKLLRHKTSQQYCKIVIGSDDCQSTKFNRVKGWQELGDKMRQDVVHHPSWSMAGLLSKSNGDGTTQIGIVGRDGRVLGEVSNVLLLPSGVGSWVPARLVGESGIFRVRGDDGTIADVAVTFDGDSIATTSIPAFSSIDAYVQKVNRQTYQKSWLYYDHLMFNVDLDELLFWPVYPSANGYKAAPYNMLGVYPLFHSSEYITGVCKSADDRVNCSKSGAVGAAQLGLKTGRSKPHPAAWLGKWMTDAGPRWAIINSGPEFPSFEDVLKSSDRADYSDFHALWKHGVTPTSPLSDIGLGSIFAFERPNGDLDMFELYRNNENLRALKAMKTVSASGLDQFVRDENAKRQQAIEDQKRWLANYRIQQAARAEADRLARLEYERRLAENRRLEAEARAQREAERAARLAAEQQYYQQAAPAWPSADPWAQAWADYAAGFGADTPTGPSASIDYWKSYDSSNWTGSYVTSSGASTNCRIGSSSC